MREVADLDCGELFTLPQARVVPNQSRCGAERGILRSVEATSTDMPVLIPKVAAMGESPYLDGSMLVCGVDVGNIPVPIEIVGHDEGMRGSGVRFHACITPYPRWIASVNLKNFFFKFRLAIFRFYGSICTWT